VVVLFVVGMFVNIPGREIHQSCERP
jgi:hypothetical protein